MKLGFIWHMHQPDYRDANGIMQMPWVFLHAIKDYYDMPWMMHRHNGIKATFNITAPLIQQLKLYYNNPYENDKFFALWIKSPALLNEDERGFIIKFCLSTQFDTMVAPFERYKELFHQQHFNNSELLDLEVLFVLAWCGVYLRQNNEFIKYLIAKERDFSSEDKTILLEELARFVTTIFPYYKQLHDESLITLATTPLNHPILPLLLDMKNALIADPNSNIPKEYTKLTEDALLQIQRAQFLFMETFGFLPDGFWPAEGAVDPETVKLLGSCGVNWIATDEEILFKSLHSHERKNLYALYEYEGVRIAFRDHALSDLIGFDYRFKEPYEASHHFLMQLKKIEDHNPDSTVFVILDGENAWEFYANNGYDFFNVLYSELLLTPWCKTQNMDEISHSPAKELKNLATGSWIAGNFQTWVGDDEKTRAWELLFLTKRDYEHHKANVDEASKAKIQEHFLAAECSDWFWWYGDDHFTEFGAEFDELFRSHLINIYNLIHITPPSDLFLPIIQGRSTQNFWLKPQSNISPIINGKHDSFFEWIGSGIIDESKLFSTMDKERGPIRKIYYGQDDEKLYFAFEAQMQHMCATDSLYVIIDPIGIRGKVTFKETQTFLGDLEVMVACGYWLELSIEKTKLNEKIIFIRFELEKDEMIVQTLPGFGELKIDIENDYSQNWFI